jgi:general L-amino acid transport system permease protein
MAMTDSSIAYVRHDDAPKLPPPPSTVGVQGWLRANLFSTPLNSLVSVLLGAFAIWIIWDLANFALLHAVWTGTSREDCLGDGVGACWPLVWDKLPQWIYGFYPIDQRWRVNVLFVVAVLSLTPMLMPSAPHKLWNALFLLIAFPLLTLVLLTGGNFDFSWTFYGIVIAILLAGILALRHFDIGSVKSSAIVSLAILVAMVFLDFNFGLEHVETSKWGGLLVTLVVSVTGIVTSLPLGIMLALGRRSKMPIVKTLSVIFIELFRGVPLITVLFMSSVMLPLFLPPGTNFDKLLRALVGVALFSAAYMAEVVRGGLQAIPKGQNEGAMAVGLSYWQMMIHIILPQALKISIPNIVGNFISLFKDTTLVLIIGLFDLLGIVQAGLRDSQWSTPTSAPTGYLAVALIFWAFCFGMSRYSMYTERRLNTGHKR